MHWGFQDGAGVVRDVGTDPGGADVMQVLMLMQRSTWGFGTGADALYQELEMHKCSATWRCTGSGLVHCTRYWRCTGGTRN